jgi:germination protein M
MRNSFFIVLILLILAVGSFILLRNGTNSPQPPVSQTQEPPVVEHLSPTEKPNIVVTSPKADQEVSSPLTITGEARVFENVLRVRLQDQDGNTIIESNATANSPDMGQFGPFQQSVAFPSQKGKNGSLEVFSLSAKDGDEINKVIIPIQFAP